jgi:uncharacterized membrane-anchored protein YhcB (DUF1043 family)
MNESELARCAQYNQILFGKALKRRDADDLISLCSSFDEFRIRVVLEFSQKAEALGKVVAHWRASAVKESKSPDASITFHMLENLSQKQNDLERKMRDTSAELLAQLQAIDSIATAQGEWRTSIDEIRTQITVVRNRLAHLDEVPVALGCKK